MTDVSFEMARTWLFAPGSRPDRCAAALRAGADQVIWDLEDAVAPSAKDTARTAVADLYAEAAAAGARPWVRLNSPLGDMGRRDWEALKHRTDHPRWMIPKVDAATVEALADLGMLEAEGLLLLIETGRGVWDLRCDAWRSIRGRPVRLAFGALDLTADLSMAPGEAEEELRFARHEVVLASRVLGLLPPIDGVYQRLDDAPGLERAARMARRLGFGGKMAAHPRQLSVIEAAFSAPSEDRDFLERAARAADDAGVAVVDGLMVDRPVAERARALLEAPEGRVGGAAALGDSADNLPGRFFEDFRVGDVYRHGPGRTVTTTDNLWWSLLTQNQAPVHIDHHYAAGTAFGRPLVDSTLTLAVVTGQSVADVSLNVFANLGWSRVRLVHPVFEGDTLYAQSEVLSARPSASRPEVGIVTVRTIGFNQEGTVVMSFDRTVMVYRRGFGPTSRRPRPVDAR